jgi:tetratricopeptide (TPR) repeat protein
MRALLMCVLPWALAGCVRDLDAGRRASLRPARVEAAPPPERPVDARTYTLRVWATAAYRAEAALAQVPPGAEAETLGAANLRLRRRFGLPPRAERFGIGPEDEPVYVGAMVAALDALAPGDGDAAAPAVEALAKRFGDAPGVLTARCHLEVLRGRRCEAAALCRQALDRYGETVFAYGWLATLAAEAGHPADAAGHLERLVALDPDQRSAWTQLLAAYEALGDVRAAAGVRTRYAARFGAPPP